MLTPDIRIAIAQSEKAVASKRTTAALHAFGVASVVTGDFDRAILLLQQAADRAVPRADVLSDLAAAYLARAARDNRQEDAEKALDAANRAIQVEPSADASFNRALAIERLSSGDRVRDAWRDYLRFDDRSGWASEARQHIQAVDSQR
jgi:tetratricopeptide (TPR) repeat protein